MLIGILSKLFDKYYETIERQKRNLVILEFVQGSMKKKTTEKVALTLKTTANAVNRENILNTINKTKQEILDAPFRSKPPENKKLCKSGAMHSKKKNSQQKKLKNNPEKSNTTSTLPLSKHQRQVTGNGTASDSVKSKKTQRMQRRNANSTNKERPG